MFGRKRQADPAQAGGPPETFPARLEALGRELEARGYTPRGLCILATDEGFVVSGYRRNERSSYAQETVTVHLADLARER